MRIRARLPGSRSMVVLVNICMGVKRPVRLSDLWDEQQMSSGSYFSCDL